MPEKPPSPVPGLLEIRVRRLHRRDINRVWEFLKLVFRDVNRETVEYQRPRSKQRFADIYDSESIDQLVFEVGGQIVGYSESAFAAAGASVEDSWLNPRWFEKRSMRPLFVKELAVHLEYQGRGVGSFILEQLQHLARVRGCTHLVLDVAENNEAALTWYRQRSFYKLDAAIFLAQRVPAEPDLLPARQLQPRKPEAAAGPRTKSAKPSRPAGKKRPPAALADAGPNVGPEPEAEPAAPPRRGRKTSPPTKTGG